MKKKTLYEFLGIEPEATSEEIKIAAQKLARKFHPSKYPGNAKVAERFNKIKLVYKILANPKKRAAYDAMLAKKMSQETELYNNKPSSVKRPQQSVIPKKTIQTKKVVHHLIGNEAIVYQAKIHWFGYLKALLIISIATYFWFDPTWLKIYINKLAFWDDDWWWTINMGLQIILGIGVLIFFQTLHQQLTTKLTITTERTIAKIGFLGKQQININHAKFEHLEIKSGILGTIFRFGTIKMRGLKGSRGVGGLEIRLSQIASPKQFEKRLMRVIKQSYHKI